ncbi:MAG: ABC transporter permease, partial [Clostridiales bacterium]
MGLRESIRIAIEGLRANKMRSILTMLGIIIGIGSVIGILTVGNGLSAYITNSMSSFGASSITVFLQEKITDIDEMSTMMTMKQPEEADLINDEMIDALKNRFPTYIEGISLSENAGSGKVEEGHNYANITLTGINEEYLEVNNLDLLEGRNIRQRDLDGERNVAVVSDKLVNNMFDGNNKKALGSEIQLKRNNELLTFSIIGIYQYEQSNFYMSAASAKDINTALYIPLTTVKRITNSPDGYQSFTILGASAYNSSALAQQFSNFFNHYYQKNENYNIAAISMDSIIKQVNSIMSTLSIAISVIAAISLLVGGIGVMNIMLVSVTERTREIGTRKALGATNNNIRMQFVIESIIVCLIGGILGIVFGSSLGYIGSYLL